MTVRGLISKSNQQWITVDRLNSQVLEVNQFNEMESLIQRQQIILLFLLVPAYLTCMKFEKLLLFVYFLSFFFSLLHNIGLVSICMETDDFDVDPKQLKLEGYHNSRMNVKKRVKKWFDKWINTEPHHHTNVYIRIQR